MKILFPCSSCQYPGGRIVMPAGQATPPTWQCPACDQRLEVQPAASGTVAPAVCLLCGGAELYKKKDFPHWLGLSILVVACVAFLVAHGIYEQGWAWTVLLGSAALDGLLYLWVGDVVVCYRCHAHYRGVRPAPEHRPFELLIGERYRQERIRRGQLAAKAAQPEGAQND